MEVENLVDDNVREPELADNIECSAETPKKSAGKRIREENSSDEGWNTVARGHKIIRRSTQGQEVEEKTQVCITSDNVLPKQFALARLLKDNKIKGISRVKYVHQYKIIMSFDEEECAEVFINCQAFADLGWRCQKTSEVGLSFGVIRDIDLDFPETDIVKNIFSEIEIVSVKRLKKRNQDKVSKDAWITSESVRLGFKGSMLPTHVSILGMKVKVEPYVFPVTQCSRCWKFGHNLRMCPSKKAVCPKCSKGHDNCERVDFRCVNCTGNHMALQKICPVYKKERRVREIMSEFNCTYRKALKVYVPPSPVSSRSISPASVAELPTLDRQVPTTSSTPLPTHNVRLMSDLFKPSRTEQSSESPVSRRKQKRQRQAARPPTPSAPPADEDWYLHERAGAGGGGAGEDAQVQDNSGQRDKKNRSKGLSFMCVLIRFKNVILSNESLESKIRQSVSMFTEWIISNYATNISASSLLSTFMNVVMNEYG